MPTTYTLISSVTVGSGGASSIDFTSIPATYTDLQIVLSGRCNNASIVSNIKWTFNGSTSGYSGKELYGDGSSAGSGNGGTTASYIQLGYAVGDTATANTFGNTACYIPNYAGSNNKSISIDSVAETNATSQYMDLGAGLWSNTAAITQVTLTPASGSFKQYSTAYLYGIKNS